VYVLHGVHPLVAICRGLSYDVFVLIVMALFVFGFPCVMSF
jgi:hypothetical protein